MSQFNIEINDNHFFDVDISNSLKRDCYKKISHLEGAEFKSEDELFSKIEEIKLQSTNLSDEKVILFIFENRETGGLMLRLCDCWSVISRLKSDLRSDIIIVEETLRYGVCIEIEEYGFTVSKWNI